MPQTTHTFSSPTAPGIKMNYLVYLPPDYDEFKSYPLILFLHGAGERGNDVTMLNVTGLTQRLEEGRDIPFIVVSPQCPADDWWSAYRFALDSLLDHVMAAYPVDPHRVYLTGLSMGGYGSWELAFKYPERFAAIAPICGGLVWPMPPENVAPVLKDKPIWVFHGAKDDVVPPQASQVIVAALQALGSDVKFTLYPEADHDSWTETYENDDLYDWFLQHSLIA